MSLRIRTGVCETVFAPIGERWDSADTEYWIKALQRVIDADKRIIGDDTAIVDLPQCEYNLVTQGTVRKLRNCVKDCVYVADLERCLCKISEGWKDFTLDFERYDFKRGVKALWKAFKDSGLAKLEPTVMELLQESGFARSVNGLTQALWLRGKAAKFAEVRDALVHLDKLGLADYENGEYSARMSLL